MLWVLRYESVDAARAAEVAPRHAAVLDEFAQTGSVLLIGPLMPAPQSGALAVFRTREAAEDFAARDPFVLEGVVRPLPVLEWRALEFLDAGAPAR